MTNTTSNFAEIIDLKRARTRCWGIALAHFFLAPVASVVYAAKTENWLPTAVGTGVFVLGMPLTLVDVSRKPPPSFRRSDCVCTPGRCR